MGQATRTTKMPLDLGKRTQGGANTGKRAYLEATAAILDAARAFYVAFFLAHPDKLSERMSFFSEKHQEQRERLISADELLTWAESVTVATNMNIFLCYAFAIMRKSDRKYLRIGKAAEELGLHPITIRRWIKTGRMQAVRVGIEARVPRSEIERLLGQADRRLLVLYARVSGHDQRPDFDRQIERLQTWATAERAGQEVLVLSDLGSGLGTARKRFQQLLKLVCDDRVGEVAITSPNRLTRFGTEYLRRCLPVLASPSRSSIRPRSRRQHRNSWKIC